jgi:hypothetical protein
MNKVKGCDKVLKILCNYAININKKDKVDNTFKEYCKDISLLQSKHVQFGEISKYCKILDEISKLINIDDKLKTLNTGLKAILKEGINTLDNFG